MNSEIDEKENFAFEDVKNNKVDSSNTTKVEDSGTPSSIGSYPISDSTACMYDNGQDEKSPTSLEMETSQKSVKEGETEITETQMNKSEVKICQCLTGNIETRYIANQGFQHIFISDSTHDIPKLDCFKTLKLRNGDQLLDINDEDVTLMPNHDVLSLIEKIPLNNNTTMVYWRPSTNCVTDITFCLYLSGETIKARLINESTSCVRPDWDMSGERTVVFQKRGTDKFMQHLDSQRNNIIIEKIISMQPGKKPCDFLQCRFLEKRRIVSTKEYAFYIRRYSTTFKDGEKKYLHVTDQGDLDLVSEFTESSNFKIIPASLHAFIVLNEILTDRCLKLEGHKGKFLGVDYSHVDHIDEEYRFQVFKCTNNCNKKCSSKHCIII